MRLTREEIVKEIRTAGEYESYAAADRAMRTVMNTLADLIVTTGEVTVHDFGRFKVRPLKTKGGGVNPNPVDTMVLRFKPCLALKDRVARK